MINIIDGYGFDYDGMNYTLYETGRRECYIQRTKIKTGEVKDYADAIGYYSTIDAMAAACLDKATKKAADSEDVKTIGEYLDVMRRIRNDILTALKDVAN